MSRRIAFGIGGGISSAALFAIGLLTGALGPAWAEPACTLDRAVSTTIDDKPFITNGYGSRWNHETNRVAFMAPRQTGYYGIFTMSPDGSGRRAFDPPGVPEKHRGMVYWRPDGRYLLFAAQKADWNGGKAFGIPGFGALPGFGVHDDIWLATADGAKAWRLTDEPNVETEGELMPIFSPDGKRIAWSSRQPDKTYVLKIADLALAPKPHLENVKSYLPGGAVYYEPGSFSSDGASLIYTSDQDLHSFWRSQIHKLDLATGKSWRLTVGNAYNEHPTVVKTPTGDWIVYMSTKGVDRFPRRLMLGTDWWAMRLDGSGAKRLTRMNVNTADNPQNAHDMRVATTVAPGPSGAFVLGDMQDSLVRQTGLVKIVRFVCE